MELGEQLTPTVLVSTRYASLRLERLRALPEGRRRLERPSEWLLDATVLESGAVRIGAHPLAGERHDRQAGGHHRASRFREAQVSFPPANLIVINTVEYLYKSVTYSRESDDCYS